jgi:hypothetical protein
MVKRGLPKKYAKMGFKKGWAAYKRSKGATSRAKPKTRTITKYKRRTMAKRKPVRRRTRKSTSFMGVNLSKVGAAMIYGALRSKSSNYLAPYTSKIPLGNVSDEVGMFGAAYLAKKFLFKKAGIMRDALTIGQGIEMARVGEAIINGQVGLNIGGASAPSTSGNVF